LGKLEAELGEAGGDIGHGASRKHRHGGRVKGNAMITVEGCFVTPAKAGVPLLFGSIGAEG
jgi:hypothetical protein